MPTGEAKVAFAINGGSGVTYRFQKNYCSSTPESRIVRARGQCDAGRGDMNPNASKCKDNRINAPSGANLAQK
jgi:hypothetical protein